MCNDQDQGDYVVREGEVADGTYFIWDGEVSLILINWYSWISLCSCDLFLNMALHLCRQKSVGHSMLQMKISPNISWRNLIFLVMVRCRFFKFLFLHLFNVLYILVDTLDGLYTTSVFSMSHLLVFIYLTWRCNYMPILCVSMLYFWTCVSFWI